MEERIPLILEHREQLSELLSNQEGRVSLSHIWTNRIDAQVVGSAINYLIETVSNQVEALLTCTHSPTSGDAKDVEEIFRGLERCSIILDYTWEQLNTGHWSKVPVSWRSCYAIASLFKAILTMCQRSDMSDIIRAMLVVEICDMGILMGAPLIVRQKNILAAIASIFHASIPREAKLASIVVGDQSLCPPPPKEELTKRRKLEFPIDIVDNPDLLTFYNQYLVPQKPVIIDNALDDWPAFSG